MASPVWWRVKEVHVARLSCRPADPCWPTTRWPPGCSTLHTTPSTATTGLPRRWKDNELAVKVINPALPSYFHDSVVSQCVMDSLTRRKLFSATPATSAQAFGSMAPPLNKASTYNKLARREPILQSLDLNPCCSLSLSEFSQLDSIKDFVTASVPPGPVTTDAGASTTAAPAGSERPRRQVKPNSRLMAQVWDTTR
uniref:Uncharacterized protein n=1 Tax=Aegilops tauschii TaxID=37682 RepID=M8CRU2_AEGTA